MPVSFFVQSAEVELDLHEFWAWVHNVHDLWLSCRQPEVHLRCFESK